MRNKNFNLKYVYDLNRNLTKNISKIKMSQEITVISSLHSIEHWHVSPSNFLNDLLEVIHFVLQKKELDHSSQDLPLSETENEMINSISKGPYFRKFLF